jgi:hypothetical protein
MSSTKNKTTKEIGTTLGITMKSTATSFCIRSKFHIFLKSLFKVEGLKGKASNMPNGSLVTLQMCKT